MRNSESQARMFAGVSAHRASINRTRSRVLRIRVNDDEYERCAQHAEDLGYRSVADWHRECASQSLAAAGLAPIPRQPVGAPLGNRNKAGKPGRNQYKKISEEK